MLYSLSAEDVELLIKLLTKDAFYSRQGFIKNLSASGVTDDATLLRKTQRHRDYQNKLLLLRKKLGDTTIHLPPSAGEPAKAAEDFPADEFKEPDGPRDAGHYSGK